MGLPTDTLFNCTWLDILFALFLLFSYLLSITLYLTCWYMQVEVDYLSCRIELKLNLLATINPNEGIEFRELEIGNKCKRCLLRTFLYFLLVFFRNIRLKICNSTTKAISYVYYLSQVSVYCFHLIFRWWRVFLPAWILKVNSCSLNFGFSQVNVLIRKRFFSKKCSWECL